MLQMTPTIGGSFVWQFWGMTKWPPIKGWLLTAGSTVPEYLTETKKYSPQECYCSSIVKAIDPDPGCVIGRDNHLDQ